MPAPANDTPLAVTDQASAIVAATAVVEHARRHLRIFAPALDPGLLDAADWLAALRRFATRPGDKLVQVLLVDADNRVHLQAVQLGSAQNDRWAVTSGLKAGDRIVTEGLQHARPGEQVQIDDPTLPLAHSTDR